MCCQQGVIPAQAGIQRVVLTKSLGPLIIQESSSFAKEALTGRTIYGNLEVIGPDNGLVYLSNNTTDSTTKVSWMMLHHYTNAEEPVYLFGAASTSTNNFVAMGGGSTLANAATQIDLFTAENTTTPVGTSRLTIIGNGYVGIGIQDPWYPLEMASGFLFSLLTGTI